MSKTIVLDTDIITAESIENGDSGGMILCTKKSEVAGIITYSSMSEQWKFVNGIDFEECIASKTLIGLLHILLDEEIIDSAVLE